MNFVRKEALYHNGTEEFNNLYEAVPDKDKIKEMEKEDEDEEKPAKNSKKEKSEETEECKEEKELKEKFEKTFIPMSNLEKISTNTTELNITETPDNNSTDILLQISQQLLQINSLN